MCTLIQWTICHHYQKNQGWWSDQVSLHSHGPRIVSWQTDKHMRTLRSSDFSFWSSWRNRDQIHHLIQMTDKYRKQQRKIMASRQWWSQRDVRQMACAPQTIPWASEEPGAPVSGGDGAESLGDKQLESTRQSSREEDQRENCSIYEGLSQVSSWALNSQCVEELVGAEEWPPPTAEGAMVSAQTGLGTAPVSTSHLECSSFEGHWGTSEVGCNSLSVA